MSQVNRIARLIAHGPDAEPFSDLRAELATAHRMIRAGTAKHAVERVEVEYWLSMTDGGEVEGAFEITIYRPGRCYAVGEGRTASEAAMDALLDFYGSNVMEASLRQAIAESERAQLSPFSPDDDRDQT